MIRKQIESGNVQTDSSIPGQRVQVHEIKPDAANEIMKVIFGDNAPKVEGGLAKVITLDPETSKKVMAKVLPAALGQVFGATARHPDENR
jgi:hypothetical protein